MEKSGEKIVVINQSAGYLFLDITNELAKRFSEVVLISGNVPLREQLVQNVRLKSMIRYNRKNTLTRFFSWIAGFVQLFLLLKFKFRDHQVFISSNPPLATLMPLVCSHKTSLIIYDIYPDGLVSGGFMSRNNIIYKCWKALNRKAYKKVGSIISITNGMTNLLTEYADESKIKTIPVWADKSITNYKKIGEDNQFTSKYGLEDKFVVMYSGNMGKSHALESLVQVADTLRDYEDIQFVIAGEGWKKSIVEHMVDELKLNNCLVMSYMPDDLFISSLYSIDMGVISLGEGTSKIAIPSKTFNLLAAGKPLLCFAAEESDLSSLVTENEVGKSFTHDDIKSAAAFILDLFRDNQSKQKYLAENAKKLSAQYSYKNASEIAELVYGS